MAFCTNCGKEIAEGAVVCKYCNTNLGTPKRPVGVTVIAVLSFLGAASSLYSLFALKEANSVLLGMFIPVEFGRIIQLVTLGILAYCGYGFLKLQNAARMTFFYFSIFGIINSILTIFIYDAILMRMPEIRMLPESALVAAKIMGIVGFVIGLGIMTYIMVYITRKKDYFVN